MRDLFKPGDIREYRKTVTEADLAAFESGQVHKVYATFALARDAEWACRLFVLEMKEEDEEGIGTFVSVRHLGPAKVGAEVVFTATVKELQGNRILCAYTAHAENKLVAEGEQEQKILKKEKLKEIVGA